MVWYHKYPSKSCKKGKAWEGQIAELTTDNQPNLPLAKPLGPASEFSFIFLRSISAKRKWANDPVTRLQNGLICLWDQGSKSTGARATLPDAWNSASFPESYNFREIPPVFRQFLIFREIPPVSGKL